MRVFFSFLRFNKVFIVLMLFFVCIGSGLVKLG